MVNPEYLIEQIGVKEDIPEVLLPVVSYLNNNKEDFKFIKVESQGPFNHKEESIVGLKFNKLDLSDFIENNIKYCFTMKEDFFIGFKINNSEELFIFKLLSESIPCKFFIRNVKTGLQYEIKLQCKIIDKCVIEVGKNLILKEHGQIVNNKKSFGPIEEAFVLTENIY